VQNALGVMRGRPIHVDLRFDKKTAVWVRDRIWHHSQQSTPLKNGELKNNPDRRGQPRTRRLDIKLWKRRAGNKASLAQTSRPS